MTITSSEKQKHNALFSAAGLNTSTGINAVPKVTCY